MLRMNDSADAVISTIPERVPLENRISALTWAFPVSGGSLVFVDQAARDRISAGLTCAGVCWGDAGTGGSTGDSLAGALTGPGGVVVLAVTGQDGAQVRLDQGPVQDLPAQGAGQWLADRVHPGRLRGGGLEDGIERCGEVRSAVMDEEPEVPDRSRGSGARLRYGPAARSAGPSGGRWHRRCDPAVAVLGEHQNVQPVRQHCAGVEEAGGEDPGALSVQELPPGRAVPAQRRVGARGVQDLAGG